LSTLANAEAPQQPIEAAEIDDEVRAWLVEAYAVFEQRHLSLQDRGAEEEVG